MTGFLTISIQNIKVFFQDVYAITVGLFATLFGYFLPIRDLVHLVILFFILEMFLGYLAAKAKDKMVKFSLTVVYEKTMPRLLISLLIIISSFLWDTVTKQVWVPTYTLLSWFFCGLLLLKMTRHGYIITQWIGFLHASKIIDRKLSDKMDDIGN